MRDLHTLSAYWSAAADDPQGGPATLYAAIAAELDYLTTLVDQHDPDAYETAERISQTYGPQVAPSDREDLLAVAEQVAVAVPVERTERERGGGVKHEYEDWIQHYLERNDDCVLGQCMAATAEMQAEFPELKIVKGHVYCMWGKRSHAWLEAPDGSRVDPTAVQFAVGAVGLIYEPWKPGDEIRVGTCMNCGDGIWRQVQTLDKPPGNPCVCSDECESALHEYYNGPGKGAA